MTWFFLSIATALIWAVLNVIDKFVLSRWELNPLLMTAVMGVIGIVAAGIVHACVGLELLNQKQLFLALVSGLLYGLVALCYFSALKLEEVSRVIPLMFTTSFFVLVLAAIFLDETLTMTQYCGVVFITVGAILITKRTGVSLRFSRGIVIAVIAAFLFAVNQVITKHLLTEVGFWTVFSYGRIGTFLLLFAVMPTILRELRATISARRGKALALISVSESCNLLAVYCVTLAAVTGPITLVTAITGVQPFLCWRLLFYLGLRIRSICVRRMIRTRLCLSCVRLV